MISARALGQDTGVGAAFHSTDFLSCPGKEVQQSLAAPRDQKEKQIPAAQEMGDGWHCNTCPDPTSGIKPLFIKWQGAFLADRSDISSPWALLSSEESGMQRASAGCTIQGYTGSPLSPDIKITQMGHLSFQVPFVVPELFIQVAMRSRLPLYPVLQLLFPALVLTQEHTLTNFLCAVL